MSISPVVTYLSRVIFLENLFASPEKGIIHPKWYRFGDFSLILSSSIAGPVYGLSRIVVSLFFLLLLVHRVDYSIVPHPFHDWDFVYLYYRQVLNVYKMNHDTRARRCERNERKGESSESVPNGESDPLMKGVTKDRDQSVERVRENSGNYGGSVQGIYVVVDEEVVTPT
jgi:hypothetical protein